MPDREDDGSFEAAEGGVWVTHDDVNPATGEVDQALLAD